MLNVNGKRLCSLCFTEIYNGSLCTGCNNESNEVKHPMALREGTVLAGKYSVGRVLGKGGFGVTYLCYDMTDNTTVAIKEYLPHSLSFRSPGTTVLSSYDEGSREHFKTGAKKFFEEAKLVSKFNDADNIISVYEFFYENNTAYFVMEYLKGCDLKAYVHKKGGRLSCGEAIYILCEISKALREVHNSGILHRDISPDNIFMCIDGSIKLIDFGAARQVSGEESKSLSVILKQNFAPVEQYQRKGKQGPWTDIYALGATIYYAMTGKIIDDAMSRLEDESLDTNGIPDEIYTLLKKMLAVKAADRYRNVDEVISEVNDRGIEAIKPAPVQIEQNPAEDSVPTEESVLDRLNQIPLVNKLLSKKIKKPDKAPKIKKANSKGKKALKTVLKVFLFFYLAGATTLTGAIVIFGVYHLIKKIKNRKKKYDSVYQTKNGYNIVSKDGKFGLTDESGNAVIGFVYNSSYDAEQALEHIISQNE